MVCQFCGKQVSENDKICKYCGSKLASAPMSGPAEQMEDSGMTTVMPSLRDSAPSRKASGFESSRAVQQSVSSSHRSKERRTEAKRQYYRYNPNVENGRNRGNRRNVQPDRRSAPRYVKYPHEKRGLLKWVGKFIVLAVVGIAVGILIYLAATGVTNAVKSIGNHAPSSASSPAPKKTDKNSVGSGSSVKNEDSKQSEKTEAPVSEKKTDSSEKSVKSSSDDKSQSSGDGEKKSERADDSLSENSSKNESSGKDDTSSKSDSAKEDTSSDSSNEDSGSSDSELEE